MPLGCAKGGRGKPGVALVFKAKRFGGALGLQDKLALRAAAFGCGNGVVLDASHRVKSDLDGARACAVVFVHHVDVVRRPKVHARAGDAIGAGQGAFDRVGDGAVLRDVGHRGGGKKGGNGRRDQGNAGHFMVLFKLFEVLGTRNMQRRNLGWRRRTIPWTRIGCADRYTGPGTGGLMLMVEVPDQVRAGCACRCGSSDLGGRGCLA